LIEHDPKLWKMDIMATKYFIEFKEIGGKSKISFWWRNRLFGDYNYPLDLPYFISQHYRMIGHYKRIKKVIGAGDM